MLQSEYIKSKINIRVKYVALRSFEVLLILSSMSKVIVAIVCVILEIINPVTIGF